MATQTYDVRSLRST